MMDDHDDVDAPSRSRASSTAQLVDIAFKLAFLKILLLDIGISLGDTVTDFLQGFNLILDFPTSTVRWSSLPYGLAILLASWLPLPIALLHLGFSEELGLLNYMRSLPSLLLLILAVVGASPWKRDLKEVCYNSPPTSPAMKRVQSFCPGS